MNKSHLIAGIDEVGRGALAGPVVAAAVILKSERPIEGLADSKTLTRPQREKLYEQITAHTFHAVGMASVAEIDEFNILRATHLAMRRAAAALTPQPNSCLIDGNSDPGIDLPCRLIINGDATEPAIAAASILAKVTRDRLMAKLGADHPDYGWPQNAGYGVRQHLAALDLVGPSPHHRMSFHPCKQLSFKSHL